MDLAILQDGLIVEDDLAALNQAEPDKINALVHLYKSVLCVFGRRDASYKSLGEMRAYRPGLPRAVGKRLAVPRPIHAAALRDRVPGRSFRLVARPRCAGDDLRRTRGA